MNIVEKIILLSSITLSLFMIFGIGIALLGMLNFDPLGEELLAELAMPLVLVTIQDLGCVFYFEKFYKKEGGKEA